MRASKSPRYGKRHYEDMVDVLQRARQSTADSSSESMLLTVAVALAQMFKADNPKFDASYFLKAAGIERN